MKDIIYFGLRPFIIALLFASITAPGCKKEQPQPQPTNSEKILGTWTLASTQQDQTGSGQFIEILHACDLDDTWTFTSDGTLTGSQSGTTCDPGSPPGFSCDWRFQDEETVLYLEFGSSFSNYKIAALDDKTLLLHFPLDYNDINGKVYSKVTFKR